MGTYRRRRVFGGWVRRNDERYHRNKHRKHALKHVGHVILGGFVVLVVLVCAWEAIF